MFWIAAVARSGVGGINFQPARNTRRSCDLQVSATRWQVVDAATLCADYGNALRAGRSGAEIRTHDAPAKQSLPIQEHNAL
jgi:hypothetical protein